MRTAKVNGVYDDTVWKLTQITLIFTAESEHNQCLNLWRIRARVREWDRERLGLVPTTKGSREP